MRKRSSELEFIDLRPLTARELGSTYRFLAFFNRLGGGRAIRNELERLSPHWTEPIRILDVGSGSADIPRRVARWARNAGVRVSIVCLEHSVDALAWARRESATFPEISFVRGDALVMPFRPGSFHYVMCNLFLHHLPDDRVVAMLSAFDRLATSGIVVTDVIRRRRAVFWATVVTLFADPVVRNDGPLSVKRSFTLAEIRDLAEKAGIGWAQVRPVLGHHFLLSGDRHALHLQSPR